MTASPSGSLQNITLDTSSAQESYEGRGSKPLATVTNDSKYVSPTIAKTLARVSVDMNVDAKIIDQEANLIRTKFDTAKARMRSSITSGLHLSCREAEESDHTFCCRCRSLAKTTDAEQCGTCSHSRCSSCESVREYEKRVRIELDVRFSV